MLNLFVILNLLDLGLTIIFLSFTSIEESNPVGRFAYTYGFPGLILLKASSIAVFIAVHQHIKNKKPSLSRILINSVSVVLAFIVLCNVYALSTFAHEKYAIWQIEQRENEKIEASIATSIRLRQVIHP